MLIEESGLVRAIKSAYKNGGYVVNNQGEMVSIYTERWYVQCKRVKLPRKALATIVEHMGMIPEVGAPVSIDKDGDPQQVIPEVTVNDMDHWRGGATTDAATMVPVIMQGYQIFQPPGDAGPCYGVPCMLLGMIERQAAEYGEAAVVDRDRLLWDGDGEAVVVAAVRKATSGWAKEWERAVWSALESVDLHKEEV